LPSRNKTPSPRKSTAKPKASPTSRNAAAEAPRPAGTPHSEAHAPEEAGSLASADAPRAEGEPKTETRISASRGLVDFLLTYRLSFALTSYQTGQLMLIGVLPDHRLSVFQRNFVRAMGLASSPQTLYLSSIAQVWRLENVLKPGEVANKQFDKLYVPRTAHTTGDLDIHEIAVDDSGRIVFVNTKYSCLATLDPVHSFKPLWRPSFISKLAPEDRCHLNGLALKDGRPKYVTAVSRSDVVDGWRERREEGGIIIDIETDHAVTEDLSMPHSPRAVDGVLWVLDSGRGYLCRIDAKSGAIERVAFCPGFLRGLSFFRQFALVAASLPRDNTFKGLELDANIRARDAEPRCGAYIIDTRNGDILHWLRFEGTVRELFDVGFLPGFRAPMCVGLATPEMRTLITLEGEAPALASTPVATEGAKTA
jgi:uncharacterized protein (TIGR03032 family)